MTALNVIGQKSKFHKRIDGKIILFHLWFVIIDFYRVATILNVYKFKNISHITFVFFLKFNRRHCRSFSRALIIIKSPLITNRDSSRGIYLGWTPWLNSSTCGYTLRPLFSFEHEREDTWGSIKNFALFALIYAIIVILVWQCVIVTVIWTLLARNMKFIWKE